MADENNLKVEITESFFAKNQFNVSTKKYKGTAAWHTHALTIKELEQVRDEICDFLADHYKKDKAS